MTASVKRMNALLDELEARLDPPPPGKPARPPVEPRHLRVVAEERKAA